jgi:Fe-S cluster biogenesis protein NfuA
MRRSKPLATGAGDAKIICLIYFRQCKDRRMPARTSEKTALKERVAHVIGLIRPSIQSDGGDIELVDVTDDGVVQIRFQGECIGCPSSSMTLQHGIEKNLKDRVPEVRSVVPVP